MRFMLVLVAGLLGYVMPGWADRIFPANAQLIKFELENDKVALLGGNLMTLTRAKQVPLSVGATIRDQNNRMVLPYTLVGKGSCLARVQMDTQGNVWRVWLLTDAEIAALEKKP